MATSEQQPQSGNRASTAGDATSGAESSRKSQYYAQIEPRASQLNEEGGQVARGRFSKASSGAISTAGNDLDAGFNSNVRHYHRHSDRLLTWDDWANADLPRSKRNHRVLWIVLGVLAFLLCIAGVIAGITFMEQPV